MKQPRNDPPHHLEGDSSGSDVRNHSPPGLPLGGGGDYGYDEAHDLIRSSVDPEQMGGSSSRSDSFQPELAGQHQKRGWSKKISRPSDIIASTRARERPIPSERVRCRPWKGGHETSVSSTQGSTSAR